MRNAFLVLKKKIDTNSVQIIRNIVYDTKRQLGLFDLNVLDCTKLAYNTPPPISAAVERLFNSGSRRNIFRARLTTSNFVSLVFKDIFS